MYVLFTFLLASVIFFILSVRANYEDSYDLPIFKILGWVTTVVSVVMVATIYFSRCDDYSNIARLQSDRYTIEQSRKAGVSELERVQLTKDIETDNNVIAVDKFWNGTQWDWWYVDEMANETPLK